MNILAIMGSPRRGGNSEVMLEAFLSEGGADHISDIIFPSAMKIHPCRGCRVCEKTGECVIEDDMQEVADKLLASDALVISAPVFFYGFPAPLKALIDRTQFLWSRKYFLKKEFPSKKGFLLTVGATRGKKLFEGVILTTKYFFDGFSCEYSGELTFRGFDRKAEIADCEPCLSEIRQAAVNFFQ